MAVAFVSCGDDSGPGACGDGVVMCGGACTRLSSDPVNCGSCGSVCPSGYDCSGGTCQQRCGAGQTNCSGRCASLQTDATNCGRCGNRCTPGQNCVAGSCVDPSCGTPGLVSCGSECVDPQRDTSNCGSCGNACSFDQLCNLGVCACPIGLSECDGRCVDVSADPSNCGRCSRACPRGSPCTDGLCGGGDCRRPRALCDGVCVDLSGDSRNCGVCGNACLRGEGCVDGICQTLCAPPALLCGTECRDGVIACGDTCVDPQTDRTNCGGCGVTCGSGEACVTGICQTDCGVCPCGQTMCGTSCVDLQADPLNCGACGVAVPPLAECRDGAPGCPMSYIDCQGARDRLFCTPPGTGASPCDVCNDLTGCAAGAYCIGDACVNATLTAVQVVCGGPHAAGSAAVQCRALLVFAPEDMLSKLDVTHDASLTWAEGTCSGPTCTPDGNGNDPSLVVGQGTTPMAGTFTPAGAASAASVTSAVTQVVTATWIRGGTTIVGMAAVTTSPP